MSFLDDFFTSDPQRSAALAGMANGFGQAGMASRLPMGFGTAIAMGANGLQQGQSDYLARQIQQQNVQEGQMNLQQRQAQIANMQRLLGGGQATTTPMGFPATRMDALSQAGGGDLSQGAANLGTNPAGSAPMGGPPPTQQADPVAALFPPGTPQSTILAAHQHLANYDIKSFNDLVNKANEPYDLSRPGAIRGIGGQTIQTAPQIAPVAQPFNLAPGATRYDAQGKPIVTAPMQTRATPPAGYEVTPTGLQPIKGGPADPTVISGNATTREMATINAKKSAIDKNDPSVQAYADQILDNTLDFRNVAPEYKTHVVNYLEDMKKQAEAEGKDPKLPAIATQRLTRAATQIAGGYTNTSQYKLAVDGLPYIERIKAAMRQPHSAIGDAELLDSLTKLNTGGNAITDAQVNLVTGYKSYGDMLNTLKNKMIAQGGALSDSQRKDIEKLADATYDNYQKGYQPLYNDLARKLTAARIPEFLWPVPDFNKLSASVRASMEPPKTQAGGLPQGVTEADIAHTLMLHPGTTRAQLLQQLGGAK